MNNFSIPTSKEPEKKKKLYNKLVNRGLYTKSYEEFQTQFKNNYGLRRTNDDKRKAVLTLLNDEEWSTYSDNWIAETANVHPSTVKNIRDDYLIRKSDVRTGKDGRTIDTSNIGNGSSKKKLLDNPADFEPEDDGGYDIPDNVDPKTGEVFEYDEDTLSNYGIGRQFEPANRDGSLCESFELTSGSCLNGGISARSPPCNCCLDYCRNY